MSGLILRRGVWLAVVLLAISVVTFGLGALVPGDPAEMNLLATRSEPPTEAEIQAKRRELGLDRPLWTQYRGWLASALRGDLGTSWTRAEPVSELVAERLPRTILLAVAGVAGSVAISIPLGLASARRPGSPTDAACRAWSLVGASLPSYLLAYLLIFLLAVKLQLLPVVGFDSGLHLVLPALTLAVGSAASTTRFTRNAVLDALGQSHVRAATARGVPERKVTRAHALRNASLPIVTMLGLSFAGLVGGAFVVEWIFNWPGLGTLAVESINTKDYPVIQGFVLVTATAYVVVNFVVDLVCAGLDPRTGAGRRGG